MNKEKAKTIFMGVVGVGIVVCLIVYFMVFNKFNDMTSELKKSNAALQVEVDDMKVYFDEMETNRRLKNEYWEDINSKLQEYTAAIRDEDAIMVAVAMNNDSIINFSEINFKYPEIIHTVAEDIVKKVGEESLTGTVDFYEKQVTYANDTDYSNLKRAVAAIYNSPYRLGISAISYKKQNDTDNLIEGTIDVIYYSVDGLGKEYATPEMPGYLKGATDLFGIIYTIDENGRQNYIRN